MRRKIIANKMRVIATIQYARWSDHIMIMPPITTPATCPKLLTAPKIPIDAPYSFPEFFVISEVRLGVRIATPIEIKETKINYSTAKMYTVLSVPSSIAKNTYPGLQF